MKLLIINNKRAFSLVELLAVISIASIILGISIAKLNRSNQGAKLKTSVEVIKNMLETAKTVARAEHLKCEVSYNSAIADILLMKEDIDDQDNDGDTTDMIEFNKGYNVPSGLSIYFTADNKVIFNAYSEVVDADDNITISAPSLNKQKTIQINATTGYIEVV